MTDRARVAETSTITHRRRGISMLEMLVVIGVIFFLVSMLFPGLERARELSRRMVCAGNLKQWGMALQYYRTDHDDYLPTEGTYLNPDKPYTWFNVLPPYLDAPAYRDVEGVGDAIKRYPALHTWICPSKNLSFKTTSRSGKNQIHYGMNAVLDGMGVAPMSDFPDRGPDPIKATPFAGKPNTVFMFDIYPAATRGDPRDVATSFHGNYANVLYLNGAVANFQAKDFVVDGDFRRAEPIWTHRKLYWGYIPPTN